MRGPAEWPKGLGSRGLETGPPMFNSGTNSVRLRQARTHMGKSRNSGLPGGLVVKATSFHWFDPSQETKTPHAML